MTQATLTTNFFIFLITVVVSNNADNFQEALAQNTGIGAFSILQQSPSNTLAIAYIQGPVIALYDTQNLLFMGTLVQDANSLRFALSTKDPLGRYATKLISRVELAAFCTENPQIIGCPTPTYQKAHKHKLQSLAALAAAGFLLTILGLYATKERYQELQSKQGCNIPEEIGKDIMRSIALILMYLGIEALTGTTGSQLYLATLGTTYSYHGTDHAVVPLIVGPLFFGPSTLLFLRDFFAPGYKDPAEVIKYTKIALMID
ncbi:MAG: hypothetical protein QG632_112 [Candidatus Dependentiae bacterium]|nr:hypothetical protein [Candidatus Dependentiae bacterium]